MKLNRVAKLISVFVVTLGIFVGINQVKAHAYSSDTKTIKLGTSPGPYSDLFRNGIRPILEKDGYKVEKVSFSDLNHADEALKEGSVDLNVEQHTAWLNNYNKQNNADFVGLTAIPSVPMGIYAGKSTSLNKIPNKAKVAIPNDASNRSRAYQLLAQEGIIKLKSSAKNSATVTQKDITSNPHKLQFVEINSSPIPRSLKDVNYGILPGSISYSSKVSTKKRLAKEKIQSQYLLQATVNKKDENTAWAKAVKKAYQSQGFKNYVNKHNKQGYWYVPSYK